MTQNIETKHNSDKVANNLLLKYDKVFHLLAPLRYLYALLVIIIGWVIFRADTLSYAWHYLLTMFGAERGETMYHLIYYVDRIEIIALTVGIVCSAPLCSKMLEVERMSQLRITAVNLWLLALFILSAASIAASTYNPFIYFRF